MTPPHARAARRGVLQHAVDTAAVCTGLDPEVFFRADREAGADWRPRRDDALRVCAGCPARTACAELALRDGEGRADEDDMVRAGLTGPQLAAQRVLQADRLAVAVAADRDTEGARLDALTTQLLRTAVKNPDRTAGDRAQAAQNQLVRELAAQVRQIRAARRARGGWGAAA
ncbi:WhiB family transcriptional regulator [Streptomyces sp. NPDC047999]|uniref:WhiB family transcriptional regulator n=1 Tax=Streptomyces sp. NPDC047999 TaxID=3365497 RepID=UPI00370FEF30